MEMMNKEDDFSGSDSEEIEEESGGGFMNTIYSFIYPDAKARKLNYAKRAANFDSITGSAHHFLESNITLPAYCNFCKEMIWGIAQKGHVCAVCGYNIHGRCMKKAPLSCRPKIDSDEIMQSPEIERNALFKHHFVEGNIPLGSQCCICNNSFELFSFTGYRCSRCENFVHEECRYSLEVSLCKPKHKSLLYIPQPIIDSIQDENDRLWISVNNTPLIVFINTRSGGQYGVLLLLELSRHLDRRQVFDLNQDRGPHIGFTKFKGVPNLRVLVCGGDGTVGWVLNYMDKEREKEKDKENIPIAIIPLGTGNDLARTLGWGSGYSGEEVSPILNNIETAKSVSLDRWDVQFYNNQNHQKTIKSPHKLKSSSEQLQSGERVPDKSLVMNNYMSVGVDAEVALQFHELRNSQPELFTSQLVNKLWYTQFGIRGMFSEMDHIGRWLYLEVDGKPVQLPNSIGGIIILNLPSYAGGVDLWGQDDGDKSEGELNSSNLGNSNSTVVRQAIDDKMIEVVAITGSFHMGTITVNLSSALRIAQGSSIVMRINRTPEQPPIPIQVDGEPWLQDPCMIQIRFKNQAKMMYNLSQQPPPVSSTLFGNQNELSSFVNEGKSSQNDALISKLQTENEQLKKALEECKKELEKEKSK